MAPLRIVINCAGIGPSARILSRKGPHDIDLFATVLRVNLLGTLNVLRLAAEAIANTDPIDESGQRGVVVNTASVAAFDGQIGQVPMRRPKAACMRSPCRRRVTSLSTASESTPSRPASSIPRCWPPLARNSGHLCRESVPFPKRLATAAEFGSLVVSIVEQDYLNGETIRLDGALRMAPR
jgi:NAD(P)-dependent dehydrogenase (short-subunit alcohol dehydrogenase family)